MANNTQQLPPQTAGMKAAAKIRGSAKPGNHRNDIKAYMEARGAKPADSTGRADGAGSPGNMAKKRRMDGVPQGTRPPNPGIIPRHHPGPDPGRIDPRRGPGGGNVGGPKGGAGPAIAALRRKGLNTGGAGMAGLGARFASMNGVPTGGRVAPTKPVPKQPPMTMPPVPGAGNGTVSRVNAFLANRQRANAENTKPPQAPPARMPPVAAPKPGGPSPVAGGQTTPMPPTPAPKPMAAAGGTTGQMRRNPAVV